jgi:outer membrane receptor protein involved in Fe transport
VLGLFAVASISPKGLLSQTKDSPHDARQCSEHLSHQKIPLREALAILAEVYHVYFLYEDSLIGGRTAPSLAAISHDLSHDLGHILGDNSLGYEKIGSRTIVITPAKRPMAITGVIKGKVTGEDGEAVPFAQVLIEKTLIGAAADAKGEYCIPHAPVGGQTLQARVIGHRLEKARIIVNAGETVQQNFSLPPDILNMQEVIVTGTRNPQTKLESSVAITTANAAQISERAPRSTADLLQVIPGFYVESSGGEGGNNLFSRGIPADGSFRYVTIHEDGLPVFEAPELAFANIDELMRVDETVGVMEAVRGSTGAIFASNAPAGIINFISKTGEVAPSGLIKTKLGDRGLFRTEVNFGGPLAKKWRFNIGGFYRYDHGIRDPGFAANRGGQIKANVTCLLRNGYVRLYAKVLDDRNIFYLPIPLQNPDAPKGLPGFDPNYGTLTTADVRFIKAPTPSGGFLEFDLRDGVHPAVRSLGAEMYLQLGDNWTLKKSARAMAADLQFNAIFSIFNPISAVHFAQEKMRQIPNAAGFRYRFTHFPNEIFDPAAANGNGLVVESGWWAVAKPLKNFTNHLQLTKQLGRHALTGGLYFSDYSVEEFWYWQNILLEVRRQPRALDLLLTDAAGRDLVSVTQDGFTQFGAAYVNSLNNGWVAAYYLNDEWQASEALRFDGGFRYEHNTLSGRRENHGRFNLGDAQTLADDEVIFGTGSFRPYDFSYNHLAFSAGGNYRVNPNLAFYARGSKGFRMPDFDQFRALNENEDQTLEKGEVEKVLQFEGGVKLSSPRFALFGALFFAGLNHLPFDDEVIDPATRQLKTERRFANSTTMGMELEATYSSAKGWGFDLIATLQNPRLRNLTFMSGGALKNFDGNRVRRIPQVLADFKPFVKMADLRLFGNLRHVGARFADDANEVTLPAYTELHAGASYTFPRVTLSLNAANLTNTIGLTEGNPRVGQVVGVKQDIYLARPILGRSFTFAATYSF